MADRLADGRSYRLLTLVDNFSRVSPAIEVDYSLTGRRVVEVLERLSNSGLPQTIKVDNGTEFCSRAVDEWAERNGVKLDFSRPGKPIDNAYIESFNGRCREECLDQHWFASIDKARREIELWRSIIWSGRNVGSATARRVNLLASVSWHRLPFVKLDF